MNESEENAKKAALQQEVTSLPVQEEEEPKELERKRSRSSKPAAPSASRTPSPVMGEKLSKTSKISGLYLVIPRV